MQSIANALDDDGILVAQVGEKEWIEMAGAQYTMHKAENAFTSHLARQGFAKIEDYTEAHGRLLGVWKFRIAMRNDNSFARWHRNQAAVDMEVHKRAMRTTDNTSPFRFFDGSTMMQYQYPARTIEEVFCRADPLPESCEKGHGWDPENQIAPISALEVKDSPTLNARLGIFTKEDFAEGTLVALEETVHDILVMPETFQLINRISISGIHESRGEVLKDALMPPRTLVSDFFGKPSAFVDSSILGSLNHGCNGAYNVGTAQRYSFTELTADPLTYPDELQQSAFAATQVHSPYWRRNFMTYQHVRKTLDRDIKAGEELLDFYPKYYSKEDWEQKVTELQTLCSAQQSDDVTSDTKSSVIVA
jgi:hypothetical protein